jgi:hypothetical protein
MKYKTLPLILFIFLLGCSSRDDEFQLKYTIFFNEGNDASLHLTVSKTGVGVPEYAIETLRKSIAGTDCKGLSFYMEHGGIYSEGILCPDNSSGGYLLQVSSMIDFELSCSSADDTSLIVIDGKDSTDGIYFSASDYSLLVKVTEGGKRRK